MVVFILVLCTPYAVYILTFTNFTIAFTTFLQFAMIKVCPFLLIFHRNIFLKRM